jgi:hypothetical protein
VKTESPHPHFKITIPLYEHITEAEARELAEEINATFALALAPVVEVADRAEGGRS